MVTQTIHTQPDMHENEQHERHADVRRAMMAISHVASFERVCDKSKIRVALLGL